MEILVFLIVAGTCAAALAALLTYSRTEHGFFMLREVRRRVRLLSTQGRRRWRGEHG